MVRIGATNYLRKVSKATRLLIVTGEEERLLN